MTTTVMLPIKSVAFDFIVSESIKLGMEDTETHSDFTFIYASVPTRQIGQVKVQFKDFIRGDNLVDARGSLWDVARLQIADLLGVKEHAYFDFSLFFFVDGKFDPIEDQLWDALDVYIKGLHDDQR